MRHTKMILITAFAGFLLATQGQAIAGDDGLKVEQISSGRVVIRHVQTTVADGKVQVRGTVSRRIPMRGAIPGHLHLRLTDPSGRVLSETDSNFMRPNRQSQSARFHADMQVSAPRGSVLTIAHEPG